MPTNKFFPDGPVGPDQPKVTVAPSAPSPIPPPTQAMTAIPPPPPLNTASGGMRSGNFTMERSGDPAYDYSQYNAYANTGSASQGGIAPLQPPSSQTPVLPPPTQGAGIAPFPDTQLPTFNSGGGSGLSYQPYTPGRLEDYLRGNMPQVLTDEEIRAEAKRLRDMRINPIQAELEQRRNALRGTYQLADDQADEGKEEAFRGIDEALSQGLQRGQARAIRGNLVSSNIPETTDFRPLEQEALSKKGSIEQSIANRRAQIQLAYQQGDEAALGEIARLAELGGQIEAQATSDLTARERGFSEQARGNRAQEFFGNEGLKQNASNMNFRNQLDLSQFDENLRQSEYDRKMDKAMFEIDTFFRKQGFDLDVRRLEEDIASGKLERAYKTWQIEQAKDPNSLANRTAEAELKAILARASSTGSDSGSGGSTLSPGARADLMKTLSEPLDSLVAKVAGGGTVSSGVMDLYRKQWDEAFGTGSFDAVWGPEFAAASGGTPANTPQSSEPQYSNPTVATGELKAEATRLQNEIGVDRQKLSAAQAHLNNMNTLYQKATHPEQREIYRANAESAQRNYDQVAAQIRDKVNRINEINSQLGVGDGS